MGSYRLSGKRVWVPGHGGMVGHALVPRLQAAGCEVLTTPREALDLRRQADVERWVEQNRPEAVFLLAAVVGGIQANDRQPVDFLYDNLAIASNVIHASARAGVGKLMFVGSSCFYPRMADQPIREDALLTGPLEPTNQWYAVAKIAGLKLCQAYRRQQGADFVTVVPANLYGPWDDFDPATGHVVSALIRKVHAAHAAHGGPVEVWGTGTPRREFLYVDDAADAMVFLMERYSAEEPINIASGAETTIAELANAVASVVGYQNGFRYDRSRSDGMPRKVLDASRLRALGWRPRTSLHEGLRKAYSWYLVSSEAMLKRPPNGSVQSAASAADTRRDA